MYAEYSKKDMLTKRCPETTEIHVLGLHGERCKDRIIEVYRANKERKDPWANKIKGWKTMVLEDEEEGAEELVSRWVHRDRSQILLDDGHVVHEPQAWQQQRN